LTDTPLQEHGCDGAFENAIVGKPGSYSNEKGDPFADCVKTQPAKVKNKCPDLSGHLLF
jgi:hypothetical protein